MHAYTINIIFYIGIICINLSLLYLDNNEVYTAEDLNSLLKSDTTHVNSSAFIALGAVSFILAFM